jgi:hypothetical protein
MREFSRSIGPPSYRRRDVAIACEVGRKERRASSSPSGGQSRLQAFMGSGSARASAKGFNPQITEQPSNVHSSRRKGHRAPPGTDYERTEGGTGDSHTHQNGTRGLWRRLRRPTRQGYWPNSTPRVGPLAENRLRRSDGDLEHPVCYVGRDPGGASLGIDLVDHAHARGDMAEQ